MHRVTVRFKMNFNSSNSIEDDFYQTEDYYVLLDEESKDIRLQKYLIRYGPGDDYKTIMDEAFSLAEFEQRMDLHNFVTAGFGDPTLQELLAKISELR